jgi:hypothetical protein
VQLRSHLEQLPELNVDWYYLAKKPVPGNRRHWLGEPLTPNEFLRDLAARTGFLLGSKSRIRSLVDQMPADLHWVVGHYEGISVAAELLERKRKFHLTIHDDPFGTWIRSERFRAFRPLLLRIFPRILRGAQNIDVTSWGMRNLYREKYDVKCFALYRHLAELPHLSDARDPSTLTIGHIGTLYRPEPFREFVSACQEIAAEQKRTLRILRIGHSPEMDAIAKDAPNVFQTFGDLSESEAIPLLASCDFLYAMYPSGARYELFRKTSLPIKLSTYLQAQRPILAHTPRDSSLACVVGKYHIGRICESQGQEKIAEDIKSLLAQPVSAAHYELARQELMGRDQVEKLHAALTGKDWQHLPEFDCV